MLGIDHFRVKDIYPFGCTQLLLDLFVYVLGLIDTSIGIYEQ